jgi:hypothetical protein
MSHRDAEELAAEIAYMQDDPSFHPRYNPKGKKDTNDLEARLNETIFKNDPLHFNEDQYSTDDCFNSGCIVELKNREKYTAQAFNGSFIEKIKYDPLIKKAKDQNKIPYYIVRFMGDVWFSWNLEEINKKRELKWRTMSLPKTSKFYRNDDVDKLVADLYLDEASPLDLTIRGMNDDTA